jgi:hypothetical protein
MARLKRILTEEETSTLRSDVEGGMSVVASAKLRGVPIMAAQAAAKAHSIRGKPGVAMAVDRRCAVCKERKALSEFVKNATKSGGYDYRCTRCNRLQRLAFEAKRLGVAIVGDPMSAATDATAIGATLVVHPIEPSIARTHIDDV